MENQRLWRQGMNKMGKTEECAAYFRERPVYRKVFQKVRAKYESLGHMGGKVTLTNLSQEEKRQLGGFLQKDYTENRTITVSVERLEKCLKESRFSEVTLENLLETYFGQKLTVKKEEREKEAEKRRIFFENLLEMYEHTYMGEWLENTLKEKRKGYDLIFQQYRENPVNLQELVKNISHAAEEIFRNSCKNKMLLPVFAAKTTGNPHYFDAGTTAEKILLYILEFYFPQEKICEMLEVEQKNQIFYKAGILKDDLSNDVLAFGIRGWKDDGTLHEGIDGFFRAGEPVRLTLRTLGKIKNMEAVEKNIYLLENPAAFSVFTEKNSDCAAVCVNGQPRLSVLLLLDMLKESHRFFYNGDFDPEGLLIAQSLKERYREKLILWNYSRELYEKYLSDVILNENRLKKLGKVSLPELQEIKACMMEMKKAVYQEKMLENAVFLCRN
ncbi:MAG: TIGR02679 domain-containing protein [Blautia sp.]